MLLSFELLQSKMLDDLLLLLRDMMVAHGVVLVELRRFVNSTMLGS